MNEKFLLRTKDAATRLSVSTSFIEQDRVTGKLGIPFIKIGSRSVRYRVEDLEKYLQSLQTFTSTTATDNRK
jgi:hypothetical protein